ncbi:MAG: MarR family transcriptional regulator [Gemmatimonadetes bacterium]|nr:MarR family transcriptional regulator [Gemmatimonadota bacterium]
MSLRDEIKQRRPFKSLEEEVALNLHRTANALSQGFSPVLKEAELTPTQYNVLRILRGAGKNGQPCGEIGARMISKDPDITRLLDRLEKRGLIARERDRSDRRVVLTRISKKGLDVLAGLDEPVGATHSKLLSHLGRRRLRLLVQLLEAARQAVPTH